MRTRSPFEVPRGGGGGGGRQEVCGVPPPVCPVSCANATAMSRVRHGFSGGGGVRVRFPPSLCPNSPDAAYNASLTVSCPWPLAPAKRARTPTTPPPRRWPGADPNPTAPNTRRWHGRHQRDEGAQARHEGSWDAVQTSLLRLKVIMNGPGQWNTPKDVTPPPPLYKLRPCPSYSRRTDRPNFNSVPYVVQPHKTWVW